MSEKIKFFCPSCSYEQEGDAFLEGSKCPFCPDGQLEENCTITYKNPRVLVACEGINTKSSQDKLLPIFTPYGVFQGWGYIHELHCVACNERRNVAHASKNFEATSPPVIGKEDVVIIGHQHARESRTGLTKSLPLDAFYARGAQFVKYPKHTTFYPRTDSGEEVIHVGNDPDREVFVIYMPPSPSTFPVHQDGLCAKCMLALPNIPSPGTTAIQGHLMARVVDLPAFMVQYLRPIDKLVIFNHELVAENSCLRIYRPLFHDRNDYCVIVTNNNDHGFINVTVHGQDVDDDHAPLSLDSLARDDSTPARGRLFSHPWPVSNID